MSYHEEQETLDSLKAWWSNWGNALTWVLLVVLLVLAGWSGWNYWQRRQTTEAALLYEQFQQATTASDLAHVKRVTSDMEQSFARTPYAQMTALGAATALYRSGDASGAKAQLQWTIDHASDDAYREIARIRLAGVLLDEKSYDAGLALVDATHQDAFSALRADRRGDLLAASGKPEDARHAYQDALKQLTAADTSAHELIQFKLDALGG
ncbi:MAG: tetratricopeptide repeat protein [Janthinobacterium lividum]